MIIGLTGRNGSGKGEAVRFLQYKSFYPYSLSDVIREEIRMRGMEITRERLIEVGTELRTQGGTAVLAERILDKIEEDKNYVIDSIRHPDEVKAFRTRADFSLIFVDANPEVRFRRARDRGREKDATTFDEFLEIEGREVAGEDWHGQQLAAVEKIADFTISNNGSLGTLKDEISGLLKRVMRKVARPDWDEYFMKLAKVASLRSNCVKRKVAAASPPLVIKAAASSVQPLPSCVSACKKSSQSALVAWAPAANWRPRPGRAATTRAPARPASATVASSEPPSATTISCSNAAPSASAANVAARVAAASSVGMTTANPGADSGCFPLMT